MRQPKNTTQKLRKTLDKKEMSQTTVYKLTNEKNEKVIGSKEKQNKKQKAKNDK